MNDSKIFSKSASWMPAPLTVGLWLLLLAAHHERTWIDPMGDATWAVLMIGGFYLRSWSVYLTFFATMVVMDFIAIGIGGIRGCLTPGYVMMLPALAALWLGGRWFARYDAPDPVRRLAVMALASVASVSAAFVISNFGYYWYAPGREELGALGYMVRVFPYAVDYITSAMSYVAIAAAVHIAWTRFGTSIASHRNS